MGLFDFLKRNKTNQAQAEQNDYQQSTSKHDVSENNTAGKEVLLKDEIQSSEELFKFVLKYSEYVVQFVSMMLHENYSPISAYENPDGNLTGYLFVGNDMSFSLSVTEVVKRMEEEFEKRIVNKELISYAIFYHSGFDDNDNHSVVEDIRRFKAISVKYRSNNGLNGYLAFPYFRNGDNIKYKGFSCFSIEQNGQILSVQLDSKKDYFQEKIEIKPEIIENEIGIKIKKVNDGSVGNLWGGIFGFNRIKQRNILIEYMAYVLSRLPKIVTNDISVHEVVYGDIAFKGVKKKDDSNNTFYPTVKNDNFIDVENGFIAEWVNVGNLEAVISGSGRDTFGVTYFATDYAEHSKIYQSKTKVNISLSGILFVLDERKNNEQIPGMPMLSDDFASYMPHKELAEFGCYDFMGILEDYKEINLLEDKSLEGYILSIRLINNDEIKDFFTIPMFINKENMRFSIVKKGMRLSGMFQLLGEIKSQ